MKHFPSPTAFARHLLRLAAVGPSAVHRAADAGGAVIEASARAMFGRYQPARGGYAAWAPLAPATEAEKARMGYPLASPLIASGEMLASVGRTTRGATSTVGATDRKMVWHERGTDTVPPRPVFGPAAIVAGPAIQAAVAGVVFTWLTAGRRPPRLRRAR